MTKTPQIMFRLKPEDHAAVAQMAEEAGEASVSIFCRSIVLALLRGNLILASKNADARHVGEKLADLVEMVGRMNTDLLARHDDLKRAVETETKATSQIAIDTFNCVSKAIGVISRVENVVTKTSETVGETQDEITNLIGAAKQIDRTTERTIKMIREVFQVDPEPSISDLSAPITDRRRSTDMSIFSGPDRRTESDRREQPRNADLGLGQSKLVTDSANQIGDR